MSSDSQIALGAAESAAASASAAATAAQEAADTLAEFNGVGTVAAQLDARLDALEANSGVGSGVEEVGTNIDLTGTGIAVRQFWTTAAVSIEGVSFPANTAVVWRRTSAGVWGYKTVTGWTDVGTYTPPTPVTAAPTVVVADPGETSAVATWGAVALATGYVVRIDGGAWFDIGNTLTYTVTGILPSTTHTIDVAGYNTYNTSYVIGSKTFTTDAISDTATYDFLGAPDGTSIARSGAPLTYAFTSGDISSWGLGGTLAVISKNMIADGGYGAAWDWPDANGRLTVYLHGHANGTLRLRGRGTRLQMSLNSNTSSPLIENTVTDNAIGSIPGAIGGFLTIELIGTTGKAYWNGAQVGSSFTVPAVSGVRWGFATQAGIHIDAIKMETVTGTPAAPTMLNPSHYTTGSVITSETFTANGTGATTDAGAGGVTRKVWAGDGASLGYTVSGGLMVPTVGSSSMVCAGQANHEIEATLSVVPTAGAMRLIARRTTYGADSTSRGYYKLQVTPTALTPGVDTVSPGLTGAVSFGTPLAGDVYSIKAVGTTITYTAKRANGDPIGVGTQTFTVSKPLSDNGWDVGMYHETSWNGRLSQYRVIAR